MKKLGMVAMAAAVVFAAQGVKADERAWSWSPLGVGIAAPVQLPFMSSDVYGIRFGGLFGYNRDVYGIDAGVVALADGDFAGIQGSGFSWTTGDAYGIQAAFLANVADGNSLALQVAAVNATFNEGAGLQVGVVNYAPAYYGLQFGALNMSESEQMGFSAAVFNFGWGENFGYIVGGINYGGKLVGSQIGIVNVADEVTGAQIGVINAAEKMHGVQIGVLNLICRSALPVMVVANATF